MDQSITIEQRLDRIESLLALNASGKVVLTLDEVALYTGLSKHYLYRLTSQRKIPFSKPNGKQIYFEKSNIDEWLLRNRSKSVQELETEVANHLISNPGK